MKIELNFIPWLIACLFLLSILSPTKNFRLMPAMRRTHAKEKFSEHEIKRDRWKEHVSKRQHFIKLKE